MDEGRLRGWVDGCGWARSQSKSESRLQSGRVIYHPRSIFHNQARAVGKMQMTQPWCGTKDQPRLLIYNILRASWAPAHAPSESVYAPCPYEQQQRQQQQQQQQQLRRHCAPDGETGETARERCLCYTGRQKVGTCTSTFRPT